jgi:predicted NUDIX family phosphoesterase
MFLFLSSVILHECEIHQRCCAVILCKLRTARWRSPGRNQLVSFLLVVANVEIAIDYPTCMGGSGRRLIGTSSLGNGGNG